MSPPNRIEPQSRKNVTEFPAAAPAAEAVAAPKKKRSWVRIILLLVLPLLAIGGFGAYYFSGGRYVTTDNAYVGASKVLIAPEITGPIADVAVREGQHVEAGAPLFDIEAEPYEIALANAKAALSAAELNLAALKESYVKAQTDISAAQATLDYQVQTFKRVESLAGRQFSSTAELDRARSERVNAEQQLNAMRSQAAEILANLGGDPNLPADRYPPYAQAQASIATAERNLRLTHIMAPISGTATQTDLLVKGRYLAPGTAALALVDTDHVWVDANPKETDLSAIKAGDPVDVTVDAYPDHVFQGSVHSISPGTGAQFSVLPAQNASGNWVKVVQRIPVRIDIERRPDEPPLRAGMSAYVSIDTGASPSGPKVSEIN